MAIAFLAFLTVVLSIQRRGLREELAEARRLAEWPHVGMAVPSFTAVTLTGDSVTVGRASPGGRQLLFLFDTRCGNCRITLPTWKKVTAKLLEPAPAADVIAISLDPEEETRAFVREHELPFPVVRFPDPNLQEIYRGVPHSEGGRT